MSRKPINPQLNVAKYLRVLMGLSVNELSIKTGIPIMNINRIESGVFTTDYERMMKLANALGTTMDIIVRNDILEVLPMLKERPVAFFGQYGHYERINAACYNTGMIGEDFALEKLLAELEGSEYSGAVNPNFADCKDEVYDLLTFDLTGSPVRVEVKTTKNGPDTPFHITPAELDTARRCLEAGLRYEIFRVFYVNDAKRRNYFIITADELLSGYIFEPSDYIAKRRAS